MYFEHLVGNRKPSKNMYVKYVVRDFMSISTRNVVEKSSFILWFRAFQNEMSV